MTSRELQRRVREWQRQFPRLKDWRFTARFVHESTIQLSQRNFVDFYYAQVHIDPVRPKRAHVQVCYLKEMLTFDPHANLDEVIVHELIHPLSDRRSILAGDDDFENFIDFAAKHIVNGKKTA